MANRNFDDAFTQTMRFEIGPHFDPNDPDVIQGHFHTIKEQHKVGYVFHKEDKGGETKFGISQVANPEISVMMLTLAGAKAVYIDKYWLKAKCDELSHFFDDIHFDAAVHHGPRKAAIFLQRAVGVKGDGIIGPETLAALALCERQEREYYVAANYLNHRLKFMHRIVDWNSSQKVFLAGWIARVHTLGEICL